MRISSSLVVRQGTISIPAFLLLLIVGLFLLAFQRYSTWNKQIIKLDTYSGPIVNPLMGWAPWATIEKSNQPHTLVYAALTWRDFEPQEGYFDFETFESSQQLMRWRQEGKRIVFRFVTDVPGNESHWDIPDWLFDKMNGKGDYYDTEYGKGFSPDYSDPVFIESHQRAINALGQRYGRDDFFAYIELGSLGHWGEWHTHPTVTPLPSEEVRNTYVYQYRDAFPNTYLLMRRPFTIAQKLGLGLYNDMTADPVQTNIWLDWIENGQEHFQEDGLELFPMPDGWKTAPIGGEQASNVSNEQVYQAELDQTIQLLTRSHTTFIGPNSPYQEEYGGALQEGIDSILTTIGYRIYIDHVELPREIRYRKSMKLNITFSNNGIAPMYYNWPVMFYILDGSGNIIAAHRSQIGLQKVLPGKFYDCAVKLPVDHLQNGRYSIGIAIIDPLTGQPAVRFANQNMRQDLIQYIGSFEVKRLVDLK